MTRSQFLDQLRRGLAGLPPAEIDDIINDYAAHFTEGASKGRGEADIAASLGDPRRLARELRAEARVRAWEEQPSPRNFFSVLFAFIGLAALDFMVMLPLLGWLALFIVITLLVGLALLIAGLVTLGTLLHAGAVHGTVQGVARFFTATALLGFGAGIGASTLLFLKWVGGLLVKFARLHYRLLNQVNETSR